MRIRNRRRAQSTLELMLLVIILAAALVGMSIYLKRAIQGKLKAAADDIGEQYSPAYTSFMNTTSIDANTVTNVTVENPGALDARSLATTTVNETITRTGSETSRDYDIEKLFP